MELVYLSISYIFWFHNILFKSMGCGTLFHWEDVIVFTVLVLQNGKKNNLDSNS
jgi:hypothetical protein